MMTSEQHLAISFLTVRGGVQALEEAIEQGGWTDDELKELDKAAVIIKSGAKLAKRLLVKRGYKRLGAIAKGNKP